MGHKHFKKTTTIYLYLAVDLNTVYELNETTVISGWANSFKKLPARGISHLASSCGLRSIFRSGSLRQKHLQPAQINSNVCLNMSVARTNMNWRAFSSAQNNVWQYVKCFPFFKQISVCILIIVATLNNLHK